MRKIFATVAVLLTVVVYAGMANAEELFNHPSRGVSWEGFVIEDIVRRERIAHPRSQAYFWRTAAGAEVDLLLDRGNERVAIEIKAGRGDDARVVRTLREALPDIGARHGWIVDQAAGSEPLGREVARIGFEVAIDGVP